MRLRFDDARIHFEASLNGVTWINTYNEVFALPGYSLDTPFYYELAGYRSEANGAPVMDDFSITASAAQPAVEQIVLRDPLLNSSLGARNGGRFIAGGGWQVTGVEDMMIYDLGRYVENGSLELEVRNFRPAAQNTERRHHFLSMFRTPWGNHHPLESQETVWDLHGGFNYDPGVKLLSWTYDHNEVNTIVSNDWDLAKTYQIKLIWNGALLQYFRDGVLSASHALSAPMQLRYLYLGRDRTVGTDIVTNFKNNQYPAIVGPIYANLIVKESVASNDLLPPQIGNRATSDSYTNAARLSWTTNEPSVCYVEYGLTAAYGQRTPVLGPPAQNFSAALANLASNQIYHYRIVALDDAGNLTASSDQIFTTLQNGAHLFKPVADTYVEQAGLYGTTRDHGNFGWMNLLGGAGRECYLRFDVAGLNGEVTQASLRLHGRQTGNSGAALRVLNAGWDENNVTWLTKPNVTGQLLGAVNSVQAGQWHEVSVTSAVAGNGTHDFALVGAGNDVISFDSRESTNSQPELIVTTGSATLTLLSPNGGEWWFADTNHDITWSGSGSIATVRLELSRDAGASWETIVASAPNTGTHSWRVSEPVSNSCLIRVSDALGGAADASDKTFFISLRALVDFTPSGNNPVFSPGPAGSWDENIRERGWFMYENGTYHVWYGGWQGAYDHEASKLVKLGYASSADGVNWTKHAGNPIYTQNWIEDIVIVKDGGTYYMYAEDEYIGDGAFIDLYTSTDKINWTRYGTVIYPSGNGWESHDVGTPTVWKEGGTWYMLYEGLGTGIAGQVGLATSSDGKNWTRHANNPLLSNPLGADLDIAIDSIIKRNGVYYAYGHYDTGGRNWAGGLFTSTDLIAWTAYPGNPLPYNSPVIVDNGANYFMYSLFSGSSGRAPYHLAVSTHSVPTLDVTPPIISQMDAGAVTSASATILWQTNEASDSQVEYGLTTSYGSSSSLKSALETSHTVTISNLQANTTYHYRVKSKDAAGNLAVSGNFTFTTAPPAPAFEVTLEAENMPVKTGGGGRSPGWALWSNGHLAQTVTFPRNDTYRFTLRAYGSFAAAEGQAGEWSKAELRINQAAQATISVNTSTYAEFTATFSVNAGSQEVAIAFVNDYYQAPHDRNLWVDWLRIQSTGTTATAVVSNAASGKAAVLSAAEEIIAGRETIPAHWALQSYPNPLRASAFNAATIVLALPQRAEIELHVFDAAGRRVHEWPAGAYSPGHHELIWNGRNREGDGLSTGVYFLRLRYRPEDTAAWSHVVRRVLIVK